MDIKEDSVVVNLNGDIDISCSDYVSKILLDTVVKTPLTLSIFWTLNKPPKSVDISLNR